MKKSTKPEKLAFAPELLEKWVRSLIVQQLRSNGDDSKAAKRRLVAIERLAKSNIGQLVLLVQRKEGHFGCSILGSNPARRNCYLVETMQLGVLKEPGVTWEVSRSFHHTILATEQYVLLEGCGRDRTAIKVYDGTINDKCIPGGLRMNLDVPMEQNDFFNPSGKLPKLELIAGNKAVLDWFTQNHSVLLFRRACLALGVKLKSKVIDGAVAKKRQSMVKNIEDLWAESVMLRRRIDAIANDGRDGAGFISLDGISITVCETEEDAEIITWRERKQLEEIKCRLRACFEEAKECGGIAQFPIAQHVAKKLGVQL